jgi:hypothetical protein
MNPALWLAARAESLEFSLTQAVQQALGNDRASRVAGAEEQHIEWLWH